MKLVFPLFVILLLVSCKGDENHNNDVRSDKDTTNTHTDLIEENEQEVERKSPRQNETFTINGGVNATIDYGSPRVKNRVVWGDLVPFNEVWRAGADEVTAITFDGAVKIAGKKVPADTYGLFIIPKQTGAWTVILNEEWSQEEHAVWGAFNYKETKDVLRFDVDPVDLEDSVENMTFKIENSTFIFEWDRKRFEFLIEKA